VRKGRLEIVPPCQFSIFSTKDVKEISSSLWNSNVHVHVHRGILLVIVREIAASKLDKDISYRDRGSHEFSVL
jgi:hypothetical protein